MGALNGFNADQKMKQRQGFTVTLAGQTFHRAKLNGARMRDVIALGAESKEEESETSGIAAVYRQVAMMIVDADNDAPDPEWLERELDFEVAAELLEALSPKPSSGNAESAAS